MEDGQALARQWECPFVECSAKDNENISTCASHGCRRLFWGQILVTRMLTTAVLDAAAEVFTYLIKEIERDSGLLEVNDESGCTIL